MRTGKINIVSGKKLDLDWHEKAYSKGIVIWDDPWIRIQHRKPIEFESLLLDNQSPWIFTSVNALEAIQTLSRNLKTKEAFVISEKTKLTAEKMGFNILGYAENSLELGKILIENKLKSICHPTTPIHRKELPELLQLHGIQYQPIWVYDQVPQLVTFPRFQGVLFFSPNQVDSFFQLQEVSSNIPAFCLGPTTHTQLKKFKHNTTITAQRATIESVMDELFKYFDTNDS